MPEKHPTLWTIISDSSRKDYVKCKCICGTIRDIYKYKLKSGHTKSCGCQRNRNKKKHDYVGTRTYQCWANMIQRCTNLKNKAFPRYGGRGIKVCKRWMVFLNFLADMKEVPSSQYSIERKNNDDNYCPENCEWATTHTQSRNTIKNVYITHLGKTMVRKDWAMKIGISDDCLKERLNKGWSMERIITVGKLTNVEAQRNNKKAKLITFNGETKTASEWSRITGVHRGTITDRLNKGWRVIDCLSDKDWRGYHYNK